jgi:hypothetical protein
VAISGRQHDPSSVDKRPEPIRRVARISAINLYGEELCGTAQERESRWQHSAWFDGSEGLQRVGGRALRVFCAAALAAALATALAATFAATTVASAAIATALAAALATALAATFAATALATATIASTGFASAGPASRAALCAAARPVGCRCNTRVLRRGLCRRWT